MKLELNRRSLLLGALAAPLVIPATRFAQAQAAWPSRPITIILPFPAGGGADVSVRMLARMLEKQNGWNVVIENRAGAGGLLGMQAMTQARADGYTFLYYASTFAVVDTIQDSVNMIEQAAPLTMVSKTPYLIATYVDHPFNTLQDLVDAARAQPGMLRYGHGGPGSTFDLCMKLFNAALDLDMEPVSYSGGFASLQALARGEVEVSAAIPSALGQLEGTGRLKVLATAQDARLAIYPDVPTVAEAVGTPFAFSTWGGMVAPRGTPDGIMNQMFDAIARAVADPEYIEFAASVNQDIAISDSISAFEADYAAEYEIARTAVDILGM